MSSKWNTQDSAELYHIDRWGSPYFGINGRGNVVCHPEGPKHTAIDLRELVDDLQKRGISTPVLIRFNDLLKARAAELHGAFQVSIDEYEYQGRFRPVMPIKVNQQRHVVEELLDVGAPFGLGLEAGSKPELLAAIGLMQGDPDRLLVLNGYKDTEYIQTALMASLIGPAPILVMDRFAEIESLIDCARRLDIKPRIGIRVRLSARGKGKWQSSSGDGSKFGLSIPELMRAIRRLKEVGLEDAFELLHFHIGSQITAIRSVKDATREAARVFVDLFKMGHRNLRFLDVGGGLAVDYDGSQTNFHSSKNYSIQEYANDVVWTTLEICAQAEVPHPDIISESGRALVAHHAVLITDVLGVHKHAGVKDMEPTPPLEDDPDILHNMYEAFRTVNRRNFQEAYNDALLFKDESATLFAHGVIDLETRARVEELFWATLARVQRVTSKLEYIPDDLRHLDRKLVDTYFCNFSVFQSLPDSWAVNQLFPILPIHRLDEEPRRRGLIADITCDSDGKVDAFIDLRDVRDTLPLHRMEKAPYYLGVFLVGAYQETLGDLHNLFGDTNAVHVSIHEDGGYSLENVVQGDTVSEVLSYVEFEPGFLVKQVRKATERAVRQGKISLEMSARFMRTYEEGLAGYTYLED